MHGIRASETSSRIFHTLYFGKVRKVTKVTWYLDNGNKYHELRLTDAKERAIIKQWSWMERKEIVTEKKQYTYEEAMEIRRQMVELHDQLPRIVREAKELGATMQQIAENLHYTHGHAWYLYHGRKKNGKGSGENA